MLPPSYCIQHDLRLDDGDVSLVVSISSPFSASVKHPHAYVPSFLPTMPVSVPFLVHFLILHTVLCSRWQFWLLGMAFLWAVAAVVSCVLPCICDSWFIAVQLHQLGAVYWSAVADCLWEPQGANEKMKHRSEHAYTQTHETPHHRKHGADMCCVTSIYMLWTKLHHPSCLVVRVPFVLLINKCLLLLLLFVSSRLFSNKNVTVSGVVLWVVCLDFYCINVNMIRTDMCAEVDVDVCSLFAQMSRATTVVCVCSVCALARAWMWCCFLTIAAAWELGCF